MWKSAATFCSGSNPGLVGSAANFQDIVRWGQVGLGQ